MLRCPFANRYRQLCLYALPAITIVKFRLVQNLERNKVRVRRRIVPSERPPIVPKLLDKTILRHQLLLKVTVGMNVNNHSQALIENHLHRNVEISEVIRWYTIGLSAPKHRLRIHAQPHVVESHSLYQR